MRQFPKNSGIRGFFTREGAWVPTGSAMGSGSTPANPDLAAVLRVRRIRINSGGYDDGGSYWGLGSPLWQCRGEDVDAYTRAGDKPAAIEYFKTKFPNCKIR